MNPLARLESYRAAAVSVQSCAQQLQSLAHCLARAEFADRVPAQIAMTQKACERARESIVEVERLLNTEAKQRKPTHRAMSVRPDRACDSVPPLGSAFNGSGTPAHSNETTFLPVATDSGSSTGVHLKSPWIIKDEAVRKYLAIAGRDYNCPKELLQATDELVALAIDATTSERKPRELPTGLIQYQSAHPLRLRLIVSPPKRGPFLPMLIDVLREHEGRKARQSSSANRKYKL